MKAGKTILLLLFTGLLAAGGIFYLDTKNNESLPNVFPTAEENNGHQLSLRPLDKVFDIEKLLSRVFPNTITENELKKSYIYHNVDVLLVPGHDNKYSGAQFNGAKEADINVLIAKELIKLLQEDLHFSATTTREFNTGEYTETFSSYFSQEKETITSFMQERRNIMARLLEKGSVEKNVTIDHNLAPGETAVKLYGINKWANEHNIEISLHIHFNDYPGRSRYGGQYSGFALYVPEEQYSNAEASRDIANTLASRLGQYNPTSNNPLETDTIIEAQELIALGSNASQEGAAVLLEYGYIYEPRFISADIKERAIQELAFQTYIGLKQYFEPRYTPPSFGTTLLPHTFTRNLREGARNDVDVLALQAALHAEELYPPTGKDLSSCPINGTFGPCTKEAVAALQEKYKEEVLEPAGLSSGTGYVGTGTREKLNELYGKKQ